MAVFVVVLSPYYDCTVCVTYTRVMSCLAIGLYLCPRRRLWRCGQHLARQDDC